MFGCGTITTGEVLSELSGLWSSGELGDDVKDFVVAHCMLVIYLISLWLH
jgi:hypothetical protein